MGYKHDPDGILAVALELVREDGLGNLSFGRVGERLGISDRTVVYYFPTKDALLRAIVEALGRDLQGVLSSAFGDEPRPATDLLARAWPILSGPDEVSTIRLFFEIVGLSNGGVEPYASLAPALIQSWIDWLVLRVDAPDVPTRRAHATWIVATLDGLLLVRTQLGEADTDAAAMFATGATAG